MERIEFHPIPPDENDKAMKRAFPKKGQEQKLEPDWQDITEKLDENKDEKEKDA